MRRVPTLALTLDLDCSRIPNFSFAFTLVFFTKQFLRPTAAIMSKMWEVDPETRSKVRRSTIARV